VSLLLIGVRGDYTGYGPGPRAIWILESAEIGLMILFWLICWKQLVPLNTRGNLRAESRGKDGSNHEDLICRQFSPLIFGNSNNKKIPVVACLQSHPPPRCPSQMFI
jgi:hypothetical protein